LRVAISFPIRRRSQRGQALVEFALVSVVLMLLLGSVVEFGFLFGHKLELANGAREGAMGGTISVFNSGLSSDPTTARTLNDQNRCTAVVQAATSAFGMLSLSAPHFAADQPCTSAERIDDSTWVNQDVRITYCRPTTTTPRVGESSRSS